LVLEDGEDFESDVVVELQHDDLPVPEALGSSVGIPTLGFLNAWLFSSVLLQHQAQGLPIAGQGGQVIYDMYEHPFDDEWPRRRSPFWELDQVDIPVLSIGAGARPRSICAATSPGSSG
jgi:hypothetical protein